MRPPCVYIYINIESEKSQCNHNDKFHELSVVHCSAADF